LNNKKSCGARGIKPFHDLHHCHLCTHKNKLNDEIPCVLCKNLGCYYSRIDNIWEKK